MSRTTPRIPSLSTVFLVLLAVTFVPRTFASGPYVIGSSNTVTADPTIPRPKTTPCIVQLLSNAEFDNFNPVPFPFTPPADCPGPWAKVVFTADINVTAGVQYDRTANFWLGPTNIYFGTTAEPVQTLAPSWHVESDLTDYSPIFMTSQQGTADIGNLVNGTYTGIIYASSTLEFYPLAPGQKAPVTANQVYALSAGSTGGTVSSVPPTAHSPVHSVFRSTFRTPISTCTLRANPGTNSGTPAFPTMFPANSSVAGTPASAKPKSPLMELLPGLLLSIPGSTRGESTPFFGSRSPAYRL